MRKREILGRVGKRALTAALPHTVLAKKGKKNVKLIILIVIAVLCFLKHIFPSARYSICKLKILKNDGYNFPKLNYISYLSLVCRQSKSYALIITEPAVDNKFSHIDIGTDRSELNIYNEGL